MEDIELQVPTRGVTPRNVATPNRGQRGPPVTQARTSNSNALPRGRNDGPVRPPSGALSGWEDDSPEPGAGLLKYLGKADGVDSGQSSPRHTAPSSRLSTPATSDRYHAHQKSRSGAGDSSFANRIPLKPQSSATSLSGRGEVRSRRGVRPAYGSNQIPPDAPPSLLMLQGSGSQEMPSLTTSQWNWSPEATDEKDQQQVALPAVAEVLSDAYLGTPRSGGSDEDSDDRAFHVGGGIGNGGGGGGGGGDISDAGRIGDGTRHGGDDGNGGGGGGDSDGDGSGGGRSEAAKLRGLLYSDDEDGGNDDDYQDLMTADDDALFGGVHGRSSSGGTGKRSSRRGSGGGRSRAVERGCSSSSGGGNLIDRMSLPVNGSPLSTASGALPEAEGDEGSRPAFRPPTGSVDTTASGDADTGPPYAGIAAAATSTSTSGGTSSSSSGPVLRDIVAVVSPRLRETVWTSKSDCSVPSPRTGPLHASPGTAAEALDGVLSERYCSPLAQPSAAKVGDAGCGQGAALPSSLPQQNSSGHPAGHQHPPTHHQFVSIPTAHLGEGLRQHPPPARWLYSPAQGLRSPIRGSGYVVSHAAMRPTSPNPSAGRVGLDAATPYLQYHHQQQQQQQQQQQNLASGARRVSSPTFPLGGSLGSNRTRSPPEREPLASGPPAAATSNTIELDDDVICEGKTASSAPSLHTPTAATTPPCSTMNGGYVRMGAWGSTVGTTTTISTVPTTAAATVNSGGASVAAPAASGGTPASILRFPPTHVHNLPTGQVYRSTPISQVVGASSDELGRMEVLGVGAGGSAGAVAGMGVGAGGGSWVAPSPGSVRASGSNGWTSARGGRVRLSGGSGEQPRVLGHSSSGTAAAAPPVTTYYVYDRFGASFSAPPRPSTSPLKHRPSGAARPGALSAGSASLSSTASVVVAAGPTATGFLGNTSAAAAAGEVPAADNTTTAAVQVAPAAAAPPPPPPRSGVVPSLSNYPASLSARHSAFRSAGPPGGGGGGVGGLSVAVGGGGAGNGAGGGAFSPSFSTSRHKLAVSAVSEERSRATTLSKIFAGVGVAPGPSVPSPELVAALQVQTQLLTSRGSGADGGGGWSAAPADMSYTGGAVGPPEPSPYANPHFQHQQQHHYQQQAHSQPHQLQQQGQTQLQWKASLPHLQAQFGSGGTSQPSHLQPSAQSVPGPVGLALYGRSAVAGRLSATYEPALPVVQSSSVTPASRTFSFDSSRRAVSRA